MNLAGKRLLILGGSRISCEIVRHAKKKGIITGVTDWYSFDRSPAKQLADEAYYVNTTDMDAMTNLIKEKNFDGVITGFTDSVLPYYAEICERNNLPTYGTREQFEVFIDKEKYKKLLREYDIPTVPEYYINLEEFNESAKMIEYPVIVKPADSSGSRGITICNNAGELKSAISFASEASKAKEILVEKYLDKPEVTVFWLFVNGEYYVMLLGNRHIKYNQEGELPLPVGYTYPSKVLPKYLDEVAPKMKTMFKQLGIKNGMMFLQCKVVDGTCVVYDIGYRLTGSLEYINLKEMCGFDPLDMMIDFALTGDMGVPDIANRVDPYLGRKYSYNVSILCKPGTIAKIEGIDRIKALPGVIDAIIAHPVGDTITERMKGRLAQITVRVLGKADSILEMKQEMLKIQSIVKVISDQGEYMILDGMEENDFRGTVYE